MYGLLLIPLHYRQVGDSSQVLVYTWLNLRDSELFLTHLGFIWWTLRCSLISGIHFIKTSPSRDRSPWDYYVPTVSFGSRLWSMRVSFFHSLHCSQHPWDLSFMYVDSYKCYGHPCCQSPGWGNLAFLCLSPSYGAVQIEDKGERLTSPLGNPQIELTYQSWSPTSWP